jgi:hypothetical protein
MGVKATAAALMELMPDEFADGVVSELEDAAFHAPAREQRLNRGWQRR